VFDNHEIPKSKPPSKVHKLNTTFCKPVLNPVQDHLWLFAFDGLNYWLLLGNLPLQQERKNQVKVTA